MFPLQKALQKQLKLQSGRHTADDVHRPGINADMAEENKKIVIKIKAF
jgi:beta-galactosidase beta subunit